MARSTTTCWILFVCLIAVSSATRHRNARESVNPRIILNGPLNMAVVAGQPVTLTCTAAATGSPRVEWIEFTTNPAGARISDSGVLLPGHPNVARYTLNYTVTNTTEEHDLTINPTIPGDGGKYLCRDVNAADSRYAELVIIDALPNCTNTLPPGGVVNENTYQTADCTINFHGDYGCQPYMRWTGYGTYDQISFNTNTSVWSGIHFNVSRVMDTRAFQCNINFTTDGFGGPNTASNAPSWNWQYQTIPLYVQYGPTNMSYAPVQPSYEVGTILTCYSDAMPLASYTWYNLITLEQFNSQSLTITANMVGILVLRCEARNSVSTGNIFANLTVNAPTTPAPSTTPTTRTTIAPVSNCDDLTGQWDSQITPTQKSRICINVDTSVNGLLHALYWNDTNEAWATEMVGTTNMNTWDELGFAGIWPVSQGVSAFAGECRRCFGVETMIVNTLSRSSLDFPTCTDGGSVITSPSYTFSRTGSQCSYRKRRHAKNPSL